MPDVEIRRARMEDTKQLNEFFETVITDTFIKEGIGEKLNDMNDEIEDKKHAWQAILKAMERNGIFWLPWLETKL